MAESNDGFDNIAKLLSSSEIPIGNKKYKLRFSLTDIIELEKEGLKISLLGELLKNKPMLTISKVLYAGFSEEDKKEMTYENFCDSVTADILLNFVKNLSGNISTVTTALNASLPKADDNESKENEKIAEKKS